jgi:type IV pilus assembly protein PilQ
VNRIDFLGEKGGRSTLSIETTAKIDYNIQKVSDTLLELRLMNANIAEFRQRPMITTRFESAVNRIMPIQLPSMTDFFCSLSNSVNRRLLHGAGWRIASGPL